MSTRKIGMSFNFGYVSPASHKNRPRCVQLVWSNVADKSTVWAEVTNKIKDSLISAFDSAIASREEEVKRSESQRQMPGWNFCTFFILKVRPLITR